MLKPDLLDGYAKGMGAIITQVFELPFDPQHLDAYVAEMGENPYFLHEVIFINTVYYLCQINQEFCARYAGDPGDRDTLPQFNDALDPFYRKSHQLGLNN